MRPRLHTPLLLLLVAAAMLVLGASRRVRAQEGNAAVERGKYLVTFGGCNDCHTPWVMGEDGPHPDMTHMLSGHPAGVTMAKPPKLPQDHWGWVGAQTMTAFAGPWGVSYAANLTPDKTGLGDWTEAQFIEALRQGKHKGDGRAILPPMPWQNLAKATDEDLKAVFAYLRSIPAVENKVPQPQAVKGRPGAAGEKKANKPR